VEHTPAPYTTLRLKLIDEASSRPRCRGESYLPLAGRSFGVVGRQDNRAGGVLRLPHWRNLLSDIFLTLIENLLIGQKLSEYHTGYRAWRRAVIERLPLPSCSDDFVFDNRWHAAQTSLSCCILTISTDGNLAIVEHVDG
jgi:hypothetical protein